MSELLGNLRQKIEECLDLTIGTPSSIAYLGFPNHSNVGDSMIWLGTKQYLKEKRLNLVYTADNRTYEKSTLASQIGEGTILLHGGGNFGDVWPGHHNLRLRVIQDFPNNRIVSLAQTAHFQTKEALQSTQRVIDQHKHLIMLARDAKTFGFMIHHFQCPIYLCPDTAFLLHPTTRFNPGSGVLCLLRTDKESSLQTPYMVSAPFIQQDWLHEPIDIAIALGGTINNCITRHPQRLSSARFLLTWAYDRMALSRHNRGLKMVSAARFVISDRLHAHILCTLLGKDHCLMDNNYGKNRQFFDTWTSAEPTAHWCDTLEEAVTKARIFCRKETNWPA